MKFSGPPSSVRTAVLLLSISLVLPLLMIARDAIAYGARIGMGLAQNTLIALFWIVIILFLWQRQNWARIAAVALVVFVIGNISFAVLRFGAAIMGWRWALVAAEGATRICAVILLFRPQSNSWFKKL